jgi:hypothetical protein
MMFEHVILGGFSNPETGSDVLVWDRVRVVNSNF